MVACGVGPNAGDPETGAGGSEAGGAGGDDGAVADSDASGITAGTGPYFTVPMFFNTDVSAVPKAANSASIIAALAAAGGWGHGNKMQIDFALDVLTANVSAPKRSFTPNSDFFSPDCDRSTVPVPPGGNIEDETGYACTGDGDCHLLVFDPSGGKLYEMFRANITSTFQGGCLAVWNLSQSYTSKLRGDQCTSADAAGFP
ncbi:MAG TPA: hypothetical protein VF469_39020, partial [Kofleriaceae bacterium]